MKSFFRLFLLSGFIFLSGCGDKVPGTAGTTETVTIKLKSPDDIRDKRIGVLLGSLYDKYATDNYPDAGILHYQTVTDLMTSLNARKIDVVFFPQSSVFEMLEANPELGILARDIFFVPLAAGFNRNNDGLREQFNSFMKEIRANGVYDDMVKRWMEQRIMELPEIRGSAVNGVLRTGVVNDIGMPFGSVRNGKLIGFDIELSSRFAAHLGREFAPVPLEFGSLIASISTNKIDIITASMAVTEERAKMIDFSDPYYDSGVVLVARKDAMDASVPGAAGVVSAGKPFLKRVSESFYNNMILEKRYLLILDGLRLTILISIFAALFGTLLGGLICWMKMSKNRILSAFASAYINLLRGTPVLVLLMIIYYIVFSAVNIDPGLVAVIAFGMNFAAYVSEMFRTSIGSIDKGQVEAGIAGGFTRTQTFIRITAPQALVHLLPVYKGEFISLIKMTSIVGYIAVQDLTKASDIIRSRTFDAFFPLLLAAAIYLALAWLLTWALGLVEVTVDPRRRRTKPAGT